MKKICIPFFLFITTISSAQINTSSQWTWMKGDSSSGIAGVYGTQGIAAAGNNPGARYGAVSWTDASGSLWMFGGNFITNTYGLLNDLWKYNPSTNQWTWMKGDNITNVAGIYGIQGTAAAGNKPGARNGAVSWSDGSGNLWLFGGRGFATIGSDQLNDLWKYNPSTNQWTWMKGDSITNVAGIYGIQGTPAAGNKPGSRDGGVSWVDGVGNLWLFGGENHLTNPDDLLNDLWRYNPTTNEWTWMKGDNTPNGSGIYGTQGIAAAANTPGARCANVAWSETTENSGELWLFGGICCPDGSGFTILNELWKYSPFTNQWTWMKGDSAINVAGVYGTQGTSAIANKPGSRGESVSWKDTFGNLWLFGGSGFAAVAGLGSLNDLWTYDPSTNQWTWMKGDNFTNAPGIYGTQGTSAITNKPGARWGGVSWKDASGNVWLWGGGGYAATTSGYLNDLWKIGNFNILPITLLDISAQRVQNNVLVNWQTLQEINTSHFIVERSSDGRNFSTLASVTASGNTSLIRNYSFTDQHPFQPVNYYRLKIVDADGRFSYSKVVAVKMNATDFLQIFPNPVHDILFVQANGINENATLEITDATGRKLKEEKIILNGSTSFSVDIKDIPKGVYYLLFQSSSKIQQRKFVKQ